MAPRPEIYGGGTGTLASLITETLDAGTATTPAAYDIWNDKGGATNADPLKNARIVQRYWNGTQWVANGYPPVDELWYAVAVTGSIKTGDPNMADQTTGYVRIGKNSELALGDIPKNCARTISVFRSVPAGAAENGHRYDLFLVFDEASMPLTRGIALALGGGVVPDRLVSGGGVRRLRNGRSLTAAGTDVVTITKGSYTYDGVPKTKLQATVTLNQQDGAAAALASGESYKAVLSQQNGGGVTVTKGNKGTSPATPATPAGEILLGVVAVLFRTGGTSQINQSDIDTGGVIYGEYLPHAGTGLTLRIGAGESISDVDTNTFHGAESTLNMTPSATSHIWVNPDGTFTKNTTGVAPQTGSEKIAGVVTGASAITSVTDKRDWSDRRVPLGPLDRIGTFNTTLTGFDWLTIPEDCYLDETAAELGDLGTGATGGQFKFDVKVLAEGADIDDAGTTIYTSFGTDDQRPKIAFNATTRIVRNADHEVILLTKGQRVRGDLVEIPTGGFTADPKDLKIGLDLRRK